MSKVSFMGELEIADKDARENIEIMKNDISKLNKKTSERTIIIGDSYDEGTGATDGKGWGEHLRVLLGLETNEVDYFNFWEGGSGFENKGINGNTFEELLTNYSNIIDDKESITRIVVCGGTNDGYPSNTYTEESILAKIESFVNYCKTTYPNAKIYIGMIGNAKASISHRFNLSFIILPAYKNCTKFGAIYLTGVENINKNYNLFTSDNIHLTDYSLLAEGIFNAMNGSNHKFLINMESENISCILPNFKIVSNTMNDLTYLNLLSSENTLATSLNLTNEGAINCGTINIPNFRGSNTPIMIPSKISIVSSNGETFYNAWIQLMLTGNAAENLTLRIHLEQMVTLTNITKININLQSYVIPTIFA